LTDMSQDNQKRDAHCANQRGDAEDVAHGLSPHACTHAGLPSTGLRRTLDLRREKVAALPVSVSPGTHGSSRDATYRSEAFLLQVAKSLQLDDAECGHLFVKPGLDGYAPRRLPGQPTGAATR